METVFLRPPAFDREDARRGVRDHLVLVARARDAEAAVAEREGQDFLDLVLGQLERAERVQRDRRSRSAGGGSMVGLRNTTVPSP